MFVLLAHVTVEVSVTSNVNVKITPVLFMLSFACFYIPCHTIYFKTLVSKLGA